MTVVAIICGGRDCVDHGGVRALLMTFDRSQTLIMTGGQRGADELADDAARELGLDRVVVPANWVGCPGRSGGFRRNARMLAYARAIAGDDAHVGVFAFPGGVGTRGMVGLARAARVHVRTVGWVCETAS